MHKQYISVTNNGCDNYEYYYISSFDCNEIYKNSDAYNDNDTPIGTYIFIMVFLFICGLILGVFR